MRKVWLAVILMTACVQSQSVECDDGRLCPAGFTCTATGCATAGQLAACDGLADLDTCAAAGTPGHCVDGACLPSVCGNGAVEPGEVCDDGNQFGGDGCNGTCSSDERCGNGMVELDEECDSTDATCSAVCTIVRCGNGIVEGTEVCDDGNNAAKDGCSPLCDSNEKCGNGVLDFFADEQCDDANRRDFDGCNAACEVERIGWLPNDPATGSPPARGGAAAYDTARRRFVVFGGSGPSSALGDTWELEGSSWIKRSLSKTPPPRSGSAMTYDPRRGRIVMWGGNVNGPLDTTTWEYDGVTWRDIATVHRPPGRTSHQLAYDSARKRVVLFGGVAGGAGTLNDTWEYDGADWVQTTADSPSAAPERRSDFGMAYDATRGRVILYGGLGFSNAALNDTWQYDGTAWTAVTGTAPSAGRNSHALVYDVARGATVLIGGVNAAGTTLVNDTWSLGPTGWTVINGAAPGRRAHVAAYDAVRARTILYGGLDSSSSDATTVRELAGSTWNDVTIEGTPPGRYQAMAAFDTSRGELIKFGGQAQVSFDYDTWALGETGWRKLATVGNPTQPSPTNAAAMAYDASRDVTVMFGGTTGNLTNETWELSGLTWTRRTPTTSPPAMSQHRMIYDSVRQRILVFGGLNGPTIYNDLWEWNPTANTWTMLTPAMKPPARYAFAMAYDSLRDRIVVWGGNGISGNNDTWLFDGTNWSKFTSTSPAWRADSVMDYDAARDRMVMHGGGLSSAPLDETWELAGNVWTQAANTPTDVHGPATTQQSMVYDPVHARIVLFGGQPTSGRALVYTYGALPTRSREGCTIGIDYDGDALVGCADDDCWGVCTPSCVPGSTSASCAMQSRCGDGNCDAVETCRMCPADCPVGAGACTVRCGDGFCDTGETLASCPGDCN